MIRASNLSRRSLVAIYIGIGVLVFIVAAIVFIASRPDDFHVERSAQVSAPPDAVFPLINDFHQWARWSPYEKFDPDMKKTFEGPEAGPGAVYAWDGNSKAGAGRTTILESKPGELVAIKLEMFKPFAGTNQVAFKLVPTEGGTRVTWGMDGKYNFITKGLCLFMDM